MNLQRKILTSIATLTFLLILAMSATYYYLFTRDIRERSYQNITMAYEQIFDDLHTRIISIQPKIEQFLKTSIVNPMYMVQMFREQRDSSEPVSTWYVKKLMTYLGVITTNMREFGMLIEAAEIEIYGKQGGLLVVARHTETQYETSIYLPEVNSEQVIPMQSDERFWYAGLQDLADIPLQAFPEHLSPRYQGDIPDSASVELGSFGGRLMLRLTVPVLERESLQGVCIIYLGIRQQDVERYARLSGTEVNVFAGSVISVGTLPEYKYIPRDITTNWQKFDMLTLTTRPSVNFSNMKIQGDSYYQGTVSIGDGEKMFGAITVHFPRSLEEKQKKNLLLVIAGIAFVFSILAVAEALGLSTIIVRPITRLMGSMQEIEQGNLESKTPIETHDEIGRLAETFNSMTTRLRSSFEKIEEQHNLLRTL